MTKDEKKTPKSEEPESPKQPGAVIVTAAEPEGGPMIAVEPVTVGVIIAGIAAVIAGASLVQSVLDRLLTALASIDRKIAVGINNHTGARLIDPKFYLFSGKIEGAAIEVAAGQAGFLAASKSWGAARGTVGVVSYLIEGTGERLAILWSVPFDYLLYENWFKLAILPKEVETNYDLYVDMYYDYQKLTSGKVAKAKDGSLTWSGAGYTASGVMGDGGAAAFNIALRKA